LLVVGDDYGVCFCSKAFYISVCLQKIFPGVAATEQQAVFLWVVQWVVCISFTVVMNLSSSIKSSFCLVNGNGLSVLWGVVINVCCKTRAPFCLHIFRVVIIIISQYIPAWCGNCSSQVLVWWYALLLALE
jgi:hypothetical protein